MREPVKKKHHYRPAHHLRQFTGNDGLLWVYHRQGVPPRQDVPKRVGYEYYLYAPESGPDPKDDGVENWLEREIDTPAALPILKLLNGESISDYERSRVAAYVAMQDMRTPRARDYLLRSYQTHLDHAYASWTGNLSLLQQSIFQSEGVFYSIAELRDLVENHHPIAEKSVWLEFLRGSVNNGGERIFNMQWQIVEAPTGLAFLSSDIGIVKFVSTFGQPCTWRIGFSLGVSHWLIPLNSSRALALLPLEDRVPFKVSNAIVKAINKRLVLDAKRFVFSKDRHNFVEKWWKEPGSFTDDFIIPPD